MSHDKSSKCTRRCCHPVRRPNPCAYTKRPPNPCAYPWRPPNASDACTYPICKPDPCHCPKRRPNTCICPMKQPMCTDHKEVAEVITMLTDDIARKDKRRRQKQEAICMNPVDPKISYVPMTPDLSTRFRLTAHCTREPKKFRKVQVGSCFKSMKCLRKRRQSETDNEFDRDDIIMSTPVPCLMHDAHDEAVNLPSPRASGEVIRAQKAVLSPNDVVPPLPPKSGFNAFKPTSGVIINAEKDYVPNAACFRGKIPKRRVRGRPCVNIAGGVCFRGTCYHVRCRGPLADPCNRLPKPRDGDDPAGWECPQKPDHPQIPNIKKGTFKTHSLTAMPCTKDKKDVCYGILMGSFNMYDARFTGKSKGRQGLVMSVIAYCLAFHYHPKRWTMRLVDRLVEAGDKWYQDCLDRVHDHSEVMGMCEVIPYGKKQSLTLNNKKMRVLLGEPEVVGYTLSTDPTVYNLCRGLKVFFAEHKGGVLLTRVLKVSIWKDRVCYYIFDAAGRDLKGYTNFANGYAALMNVMNVEAVAEVLLARSLIEDQKFALAPIKVLKILPEKEDEDIESDEELTLVDKEKTGFRIMNEACAVVNATIHIGDRMFEEAKNRQALPVAIVAMTYAKISPPNTWHTRTLDKILRLGNKLYNDCIHPKAVIDITIDNIPNQIQLGNYNCEIIIFREKIRGQLFSCSECLHNLQSALDEFFGQTQMNNAIIEFANYAVAVWRQKEMIYIMDPYPRDDNGERVEKKGKACVLMCLNTETAEEAMKKNFGYLPKTMPFVIHGFKVLKLKKKSKGAKMICTLSDDHVCKKKPKRTILEMDKERGDIGGIPADTDSLDDKSMKSLCLKKRVDEENMGDIISLVDSVQDALVPPVPLKYKRMAPEPELERMINLDSPTVSQTQMVPPWPRPRDKTNEPPEPDPEREPTPPPTPPPPPPPEGEEEEEEIEPEELARLEAERRALEEAARRKAEELPDPMMPPPPSPQFEIEGYEGPDEFGNVKRGHRGDGAQEEELDILEPDEVPRQIILTEDAKKRYKLRKLRNKISPPLEETRVYVSPSEELDKPSNFKTLADHTQIIRGKMCVEYTYGKDILPFAAIMAIVVSYKYAINTWNSKIVTFIVGAAQKLFENKRDKFQFAPIHVIPKIRVGHQMYQTTIDIAGEGPTWRLEKYLATDFFTKYDRGMLTTCNYSCAIFYKNGLFYLYDGSCCGPMGLRNEDNKGTSCLMRFKEISELATRIMVNKRGPREDQHFIASRIIVRLRMVEPRVKLPEGYDYDEMFCKHRPTFISSAGEKPVYPKSPLPGSGYKTMDDGYYRIPGNTCLSRRAGPLANHFTCLTAMLLATMHPVKTWEPIMVDTCIEKGIEISEKATQSNSCTSMVQRRAVKNIILDGKFINVNVKKITVINENSTKTLQQYLKAVMNKVRYVIIAYPRTNLVLCYTDCYFHLFSPYPVRGGKDPSKTSLSKSDSKLSLQSKSKTKSNKSLASASKSSIEPDEKVCCCTASWTLYPNLDSVIVDIRRNIGRDADSPDFYTFELTSLKTAPRYSGLNCKLCPMFKPDTNPNEPFMRRKKMYPIINEKIYWLHEDIPWAKFHPVNSIGLPRKTPKTMWFLWDIEFPGDLYSLWGTIHPTSTRFSEQTRGAQYLETYIIALAMVKACPFSSWTSSLINGIVEAGDRYHAKTVEIIGCNRNVELTLKNIPNCTQEMYPYKISFKFKEIVFGFVYTRKQDRFNLANALSYFFENNDHGILICPCLNLAFGRIRPSYYMFDCQTNSFPIFPPHSGAAYILKCESLNRLIYCMAVTMNVRCYKQQFTLFNVDVMVTE